MHQKGDKRDKSDKSDTSDNTPNDENSHTKFSQVSSSSSKVAALGAIREACFAFDVSGDNQISQKELEQAERIYRVNDTLKSPTFIN